ncbi:polyphosphate polymerase domain-containing protein [Micromonospora sp. NBC_01813]|uniref:polyphosphate polymerase domain-containing protein n=1 Tax=Micromonospora sp. NBC_01813 TaxID=2975988 RepID=UPI002DD8B409|nr:polyphosphate polymerase domain-containing protein [Micromonospora sp. NBC_01813]WSA12019.1 polyphosphate polymerase domain-containing protein [Micromonospora sp. NBC_01813]
MITLPIASTLAEMDPIGLAELIDCAALQTRVDRKYVVPLSELPPLLSQLTSYAHVLEIDGERSFRYESVYFDTPWLASYHCAAYRRRRRFKVRTRTYLDSGDCWLEVKINGARDSITKHRLPYQPQDRGTVAPGRAFVDEVLAREAISPGGDFDPTLVTTYRRSTLLLPASASRVTIDTGLSWQAGQTELSLPEVAVVETKTAAAASSVDRMLWHRGIRPVRISKYATGLAALRPDLPDTPWRRTLRRHFCVAIPVPGQSPSQPSDQVPGQALPSAPRLAAPHPPASSVTRRIEQEASCV